MKKGHRKLDYFFQALLILCYQKTNQKKTLCLNKTMVGQ